jgi:hypothetical protein
VTRKIKNNGDWFLADIVERAEEVGRSRENPQRRCLTWINTILVQAEDIEAAYDKALRIGRENYTSRYKAASGDTVQWKVLGVSSLVPIYEDIEDGAEIGWTSKGHISAKRGEAMVLTKKEVVSPDAS